jgi:flagellar biosynthetic protein FliQ
MNDMLAIGIGRDALLLTLIISAPMLIFGLVIGLTIGIFQAVTQIQEMTLAFIPKIVGIGVAMVLFLPWMIQKFIDYTIDLMQSIPSLIQ